MSDQYSHDIDASNPAGDQYAIPTRHCLVTILTMLLDLRDLGYVIHYEFTINQMVVFVWDIGTNTDRIGFSVEQAEEQNLTAPLYSSTEGKHNPLMHFSEEDQRVLDRVEGSLTAILWDHTEAGHHG